MSHLSTMICTTGGVQKDPPGDRGRGPVDVGGPGGGTVEPAQPGLTDRRGKEEETSSQVAFTSLPRAFSVRTSASDQAQSPRKKCAQTRHSPKAGFVSPLPGAKQVYPALKLPHSRH